jgi:hypothetical protein
VPRESRVSVDGPGYLRTSVPVTQAEIRMSPLSFIIQVNEAGNPEKHIAKEEPRGRVASRPEHGYRLGR